MGTILDTILETKFEEVRALRARREDLIPADTMHRPFSAALDKRPHMAVIAEAKKASPSKGLIRPDFDPETIARFYESAGASAISVLTDEKYFQGKLEYLQIVRATVKLPVLRKDFIVDPLQVQQTAHVGADAMLLITAALSDGQLSELHAAAVELGIEPLVEVHNAEELERALKVSPSLVGINNRDLKTFKTDIQTTIDLLPGIPEGTTVVSESGIENGKQTAMLREAGVRAVLVGESLMRREDPSSLVRELCHAGQG